MAPAQKAGKCVWQRITHVNHMRATLRSHLDSRVSSSTAKIVFAIRARTKERAVPVQAKLCSEAKCMLCGRVGEALPQSEEIIERRNYRSASYVECFKEAVVEFHRRIGLVRCHEGWCRPRNTEHRLQRQPLRSCA